MLGSLVTSKTLPSHTFHGIKDLILTLTPQHHHLFLFGFVLHQLLSQAFAESDHFNRQHNGFHLDILWDTGTKRVIFPWKIQVWD